MLKKTVTFTHPDPASTGGKIGAILIKLEFPVCEGRCESRSDCGRFPKTGTGLQATGLHSRFIIWFPARWNGCALRLRHRANCQSGAASGAEPRSSIPTRGEANSKRDVWHHYTTHDDATERAHRSSPDLTLYRFRAPWNRYDGCFRIGA